MRVNHSMCHQALRSLFLPFALFPINIVANSDHLSLFNLPINKFGDNGYYIQIHNHCHHLIK